MLSVQALSQIVEIGLLCFIAYCACLVFYRLYLSPLRQIPGPKLAAATYFFEFYYDAICGGRYLWKIQALHRQYGPIVRINPGEVHINDPAFYDQIYASKPQHARSKIRFMAMHDETMFDTYDAGIHRARRSAMAASFSKQSIQALEPTIRETVKQLVARLKLAATDGSVVNLKQYYSGLAMDVIAFYCFGKRMDNLRQEDFGPELLEAFAALPRTHPVGRMFPWLFDLLQKVPARIVAKIDKKFKPLADYEQRIDEQIKMVLEQEKPAGLRTVFHQIRDSKQLPESGKTMARFKSEAAIFFGAGTETTASALTTMTYFLASDKKMLERVRAELDEAASKQPGIPLSVAKLEALPYLRAVIHEGIRLSFGVPGRLPRVAPNEDLIYGGFKLPAGTVMSESSYLIHTDSRIFPDPYAFRPERWMEEGSTSAGRNFVAFSRGARMCIGVNLAFAELYLTAAEVFSRCDLRLYETDRSDVDIGHDFFVGMPSVHSKGVRVMVEEVRS